MKASAAPYAVIAVLLACKGTPEKPPSKAEPVATAGSAEATPQAPARSTAARMLDWIDPDALGVGLLRLPPDLDARALSVIFALPPRAERIVLDAVAIDDALDAVLVPGAPRPKAWLGPEAVVMAPVMSGGTYVIRPLRAPRNEVEGHLVAAGMLASDRDGFRMLAPTGALPWKVAFVAEDIVAFVPVREVGSGLSPLTAARDLPPSDMERELAATLEREPDLLLELIVHGPLLHLDLSPELAGFRFALRRFGGQGLDGRAVLQPMRDPEEVREALEHREAPLETNVVQALVERVAYTVEDRVVTGRLQLTADDVRALGKPR
jgi:hypothetical protein